jgi:hypothetical protein
MLWNIFGVMCGRARLMKFSIMFPFFADFAHIKEGERELVDQTPRSLCAAWVAIVVEVFSEWRKKLGGFLQLYEM